MDLWEFGGVRSHPSHPPCIRACYDNISVVIVVPRVTLSSVLILPYCYTNPHAVDNALNELCELLVLTHHYGFAKLP